MLESKINFAVLQRLNPQYNKHMDEPHKIPFFIGSSEDPKIAQCKGAQLWALGSHDAQFRGMLAVYQIVDVWPHSHFKPPTLQAIKPEHREKFPKKSYHLQVKHLHSFSPNEGTLSEYPELKELFQRRGLSVIKLEVAEKLMNVLCCHLIT